MNGNFIRRFYEYRLARWRDFFAALEPFEDARLDGEPGPEPDAASVNVNPIKRPDPVLCPACPISSRKDYKGFHMCTAVGCIVAAPISPNRTHGPQSRAWGAFIKVDDTPDHGSNGNDEQENSAEPTPDMGCIPDADLWE